MNPITPAILGLRRFACVLALVSSVHFLTAEVPKVTEVDGQPFGANVERLLQALEILGHPLPAATQSQLAEAIRKRDENALQELLDSQVLFVVSINPELRVKVSRGPVAAALHQSGFTPVLVKVLNDAKVSQRLGIESSQAGAVYAGAAEGILQRQQQMELNRNENKRNDPGRFLEVEMFAAPPMTERLSGLRLEYAVALIYSSEAGQREATIGFNVGQGTQDLGFRAETPVLFAVAPAIPVKLVIRDFNGQPTIARLTFRDAQGRVYPPQAKRLAPDLFFQPHIYRGDGDTVLLPPGKFELSYSRGPEYLEAEKQIVVPPQAPAREGLAPIADTHLWYWDTGGEGVPVVLLHPASGSGLIWGYQQPALAKAGYRVIGYSRRSYFNSDPMAKDPCA